MKQIYLFTLLLLMNSLITAQTFNSFDINPDGDSDPVYLTSYKNLLVFQADDGIHGDELWVSDGSQQGTLMLKDIKEDGSGNPIAFTEYNELLYFTAYTENHGLWITDGTTEGTYLFLDVNPFGDYIDPEIFVFNDRLYFVIKDFDQEEQFLYVTDGTPSGTEMVRKISDVHIYDYHFTLYKDRFYFCGNDTIHGNELWVSDGTSSGTYHFADLNLGGNSYPEKFTVSNNQLFFVAKDSEYENRALWMSDGTPENTKRIRNTYPKNYCSPVYMIDYHDQLFFSGTDTINGRELWVSDGTDQGTYMLENLNWYFTPYPSSSPRHFYIFQDKLFFSAVGKTEGGMMVAEELFVSDGTVEGTHLFKDLDIYESSGPSAYFEYNHKMYFKAGGYEHFGLWVTDGTVDGTFILRPEDAELWNPLEMAYYLVEANGSLFFKAKYNSIGLELWSYTDATGIEQNNFNQSFTIHPNPSHNYIKFDINETVETVSIFDVSGKLMMSERKVNRINVSPLKEGSYIVKLITQKGYRTGKFIKVE